MAGARNHLNKESFCLEFSVESESTNLNTVNSYELKSVADIDSSHVKDLGKLTLVTLHSDGGLSKPKTISADESLAKYMPHSRYVINPILGMLMW